MDESKPLTLLEGQAKARAEAHPGEIIFRFWRDESDMWQVQYATVHEVAGNRTHLKGRIESVSPVKRRA